MLIWMFFCCQHSYPLWRRVCDDFPRGQQLWTKGGVRGSIRFPIQCWPWNTPKLYQTIPNSWPTKRNVSQETNRYLVVSNMFIGISTHQICLLGSSNIQSSWDNDPDWSFFLMAETPSVALPPLPNQQAACCKSEGLRGWNRGSTEEQGGLGGVETWEARDSMGSQNRVETMAKARCFSAEW